MPAEAFRPQNGVVEALAQVAGLLADKTRAAICGALLDGRAWTARELAAHAGVAASTASEHLTRLVEGGVLVEHRQGRHRYVALAGPHVAELLEAMAAFAGPGPRPRSLRSAAVSEAMARGRTCYDHLAGWLGISLRSGLVELGVVGDGLAVTGTGMVWLKELGFEPSKRVVSRACLDWTERVPHLAGAAGAFLCGVFFERGWVRRIGTSRAVVLTPAGEQGWRELGLLPDPAPVGQRGGHGSGQGTGAQH
ncbi:DNA-binding transcriptional regulator, ArsR family [Lentzea albidocapillata subsp. violacea]|uniref:DNA-binding transcriptional regulator, ArsR family n=1 Tax=Lentzea albidocapillata subsp. violacea TaxID=128104 RepID=A0A1G9LCR2_9PSEU|nr:DNA-binding transcriptional regulator, ArsR family [Lentzea albidocapillata subsp. violacea]